MLANDACRILPYIPYTSLRLLNACAAAAVISLFHCQNEDCLAFVKAFLVYTSVGFGLYKRL